MIEYERKFKITNSQKANILAAVAQLQAAPMLHLVDEVFLYQTSSFADFTQGDAVLRIRSENDNEKIRRTFSRQPR